MQWTYNPKTPSYKTMRSLQRTQPKVDPAKLRHYRICLVEDDPYQLNIVQQMLSGEVKALESFTAGHEAYEFLVEEPVDLIIADVMMPGMDGWALHAKVRAAGANRETPWLFTTCVIDRNEESLMTDLHARTLTIAKPFDKETLLRAIGRCMSAAEEQ